MIKTDFTAIDFETATSGYTSVCSLGWCVVKDSRISERHEILVRPDPFEFNEYNIKIHGITPEMVYDKPTFDQYWDMLYPYIESRMIVAHNAAFDIRVLCKTLQHFGIELPHFNYLCTVQMSQRAYPELESHRLNNLCDALGIVFNHHHAYDDAYACAMAFLRMAEDYSLETLSEVVECFELNPGCIYPGYQFKESRHRRHRRKNASTA